MHRAFAFAALLVTPMVGLSAQGSPTSQESDSTESSLVKGVAAVGSVGFSLLRLALHDNDNGPAQRFCYAACGTSRQGAALQLTAGPAGLRLGHGDGPEGNNRPASVNAGNNKSANAAADAPRSPRNPRADEMARNDDLFEFVENPVNANGLKPIFPEHPGLGPDGEMPWSNGPVAQCAMHSCTPNVPLSPVGTMDQETWTESNSRVPPGLWSSDNPSGNWALQQVPVIVNPEPGTWAMLAAGIGGLALVRRRRRQG